MPLPLIPVLIGLASAASAAYGAKKSADGTKKIRRAKERCQEAEGRYRKAEALFAEEKNKTDELAEAYGRLQVESIELVINRFVAFLAKHELGVSQKQRKILEGIGVRVSVAVGDHRSKVTPATLFNGAARTAGAASACYFGVYSAATTFGVASTGTAITGLSGAAATNATLAFLGGGSVASGGGGMALGAMGKNAAKVFDKINPIEALREILTSYVKWEQTRQEEATKRASIEKERQAVLAEIEAKREIISYYFERSFDERAKNFESLLALAEDAIQRDNNEGLNVVIASITELAKSGPFKDLSDGRKFREDLLDKSFKVTI